MLGVADLSEQEGRAHLGEGVAETEEETTTHVHFEIVSLSTDSHNSFISGGTHCRNQWRRW